MPVVSNDSISHGNRHPDYLTILTLWGSDRNDPTMIYLVKAQVEIIGISDTGYRIGLRIVGNIDSEDSDNE